MTGDERRVAAGREVPQGTPRGGPPESSGPPAPGPDELAVEAEASDEELSPWFGDSLEEAAPADDGTSDDLSPDVPEPPRSDGKAPDRGGESSEIGSGCRMPDPLLDEGVPAPYFRNRPKGKHLIRPEWRDRASFTPEQRVLILDTWLRSGLPAGDFAPLVGMSKHTLYSWKKRFDQDGPAGLTDAPRGAKAGSRLPEATKRAILMIKEANSDYGVRRISDMLLRGPALQASPGAVARVLHEAGYVAEDVPSPVHEPKPTTFERAKPNQLWQTDLFTFTLKRTNRRVYLVAFMDDHSRFITSFGLHGSASAAMVIEALEAGIASYGVPTEILTDNGPQYVTWRGKSAFSKECDRRGIRQIVSRPKHPQTLGKIERFWGTLWTECVRSAIFVDLGDAQRRIQLFIEHYNFQRTHAGCDGLVPADRYFGAAPEMLATLKSRVAANALELARNGEPKSPFYLAGNVGGKAFSVHAEGERLLLRHEGGEPKEIALTGGGTPAGEVPASCVEAAGEDPAPEAELVDGPDCDAAIDDGDTEDALGDDDEAAGSVPAAQAVAPPTPAAAGATAATMAQAPKPPEAGPEAPAYSFLTERVRQICASLKSADKR